MSLSSLMTRLRRASLFWRVLAVNVAVLAVATTALALSPATVSQPVAVREAVVLTAGIAAMLFANAVLLRRATAPLARLTRTMRAVDPLRPGHRLPTDDAVAEVAALTASFNDMLDRLESERRDSARRALAAQEGERRRVARELHDGVGQELTGVVLQLERTVRETPPGTVRDLVGESREAVRGSLEDVRRIARELRPEALDDLGLRAALAALVSTVATRTGLEIDARISADLPELGPDIDLVVYRVAQESLTNVARHADAEHVRLTLDAQDRLLALRVADDGRGMETPSGAQLNGIRGMRERAVLVGAQLAIESAPGRGTVVRLSVPLTGEPA